MTFHWKFGPGNRRLHGRLVEVELLVREAVWEVEEVEEVEVEFVTSVVLALALAAQLAVVVPLEGTHLVGFVDVLEGNGLRWTFSAW